MAKNVLGESLVLCSKDPLTGFLRNGKCDTFSEDTGMHTVCALMTDKFLSYSKNKGNDLSTPRAEFNFPGLKNGDYWCLCAERWKEAYDNDCPPKVFLKRTNKKALTVVDINILKEFSIDLI